ncbi:inositol monophosphatase family protein [Mangrovitalea sediminis]|uniref:inositol monophosphatase family protein n=1 Tax=Mangrovitalea sediminis TaxID=1982043 RepID=UPI000BE4EAEB|nr:inositol monophosphatase family protein [Mangrovitalea sediminis]
MTEPMIAEIAAFARDIARKAGEIITQERAGDALEHRYKAQQELVTSADLKADALITGAIREQYPSHRILSEESHPDLAEAEDLDSPLWIIDPIDGTVNYAYGHNQVAVSIAWGYRGKIQVGIVHCPFQGETFEAVRGQGATLNNRPIRHSGCDRLSQALVATGFPYGKDRLAPLIRRLDAVLHHCRDIRRNGSAALDICWVAAGRLDAYYETVSPWDCAAAALVAQEAGARSGHFLPVPEGRNPELWSQNLLITAPALYEPLQTLLQEASSEGISR